MTTFRSRPTPSLPLLGALVAAASLAACAEAGDPTAVPTDAVQPERAEARGGGKGGPGAVQPPSLEEFYLYVDGSGQQILHAVVGGSVSEVGYQTVLDYFPDGARTDGEHYEYFELYAPRDAGTVTGDGDRHVDLPFEGKIAADATYFDHPHLDVDGSGGDPYAFQVLGFMPDGGLARLVPDGTVDAGLGLHGSGARSAIGVFRGPAAADAIWVDAIAVGAVTCTQRTERVGKGKDRTERTVTEVVVGGDVWFDTEGPSGPDDPWREIHLYDAASGLLSAKQTYGSGSAFQLGLALEGTPGDLYVVVDYVRPDAEWGVYDPARNATAIGAPGLSLPGVPLAVSAAVSCPAS